MKYLYLLSGEVGVGKDTCADIIVNFYKKIYRQAMADPLKNITLDFIRLFTKIDIDLVTLNQLKDEKDHHIVGDKNIRDLLYDVSNILKQELGDDVWLSMFMKKWLFDYDYAIASDIRFNELILIEDYLKTNNLLNKVKIIHIIVVGPSRNRKYNPSFLKNIPKKDNSYIVENDSNIDDLRLKLAEFIR